MRNKKNKKQEKEEYTLFIVMSLFLFFFLFFFFFLSIHCSYFSSIPKPRTSSMEASSKGGGRESGCDSCLILITKEASKISFMRTNMFFYKKKKKE
jgi:hypothetical protein